MSKKLNIACGGRYHKNWINIDLHADSNLVQQSDILSGLPYDNDSINVAYSSHLLEHLSPKDCQFVVNEIYRVLKIGGIARIVVPDLKNICREYLNVLDSPVHDSNFEKKYEWITTELLDQLTRTAAGGEMGKIFNRVRSEKDGYSAEYILHRIGEDVLTEKKNFTRQVTTDRIRNKLLYGYLKFVRFLIPKSLRETVFTNTSTGEKHRWMYDEYSLSKLLENSGFKEVSVESYNTSRINEFNSYQLDIKDDGTPYKGSSSIYVEAIK